MISMFIDEAKIQSDLSQMIQKGGLHKQQATRASQVSAEVVDDYARKIFSSTPYTYGSSDTHLNGNQVSYMLNKSKNLYIPRKRWRKWASKKYSVKFETKKETQEFAIHSDSDSEGGVEEGEGALTLMNVSEMASAAMRPRRIDSPRSSVPNLIMTESVSP